MIGIAFRFLAGRYYATGWDHHVNEGVVEWPPSPWRIVRALVSAAHRATPSIDTDEARRVLSRLLDPPVYRLPRAAAAHTRHYMPTDAQPKLVFDTFALPERDGELVVAWPGIDLGERDGAILDRLLEHIGYLGRSESWVEARRVSADVDGCPVRPLADGETAPVVVSLLAPMTADVYAAWRDGFRLGQPKKSKTAVPETWWDVLHQDTGTLQKDGWSSPPGVHWIRYGLAEEPFRVVVEPRRARATEKPTVARFALSSAVLPRIEDAVSIGDRMRQALMAHSRRISGNALPAFSGHDAEGSPLRDHHHAFYLPADDDGDQRIDHIVVWARAGFDGEAREALESVRRLWGTGGHDIHVALVGLGTPSDYAFAHSDASPRHLGSARVWRSSTPFVLTRHPKQRRGLWIDTPQDQVMRGLAALGLPLPTAVAEITSTDAPIAWHRFVCRRRGGGAIAASTRGYGFRLMFAEAVQGPIALGYGAHQGLGQFVALD